jgi:hypothetical protein
MSFLDAAIAVLISSNEPLSTREILNRAMAAQLITTAGKTPEATMTAALYRALDSGRIIKVAAKGPVRAKRGSVRWTVKADQARI